MHVPCQAHESAVWSLAWHPLGHLLASGSNDHAIKFWCRSRPGDGKKRAREDEGKEEEVHAAAALQPYMRDGLQPHAVCLQPTPMSTCTHVHVHAMCIYVPRWTRRPSAC